MLPLPAAIKRGCGGGREEADGDMRICVISNDRKKIVRTVKGTSRQ